MTKIAIIGNGYLGKAYHKVFPDALVYDEPILLGMIESGRGFKLAQARGRVNKCDMAIVAVPTDPLPDGSLDMSIVKDIILEWLDTPLILIKSALMPGTVDHLVEITGKKIAVSVEYIGMGSYYLDPHDYPDPLDPQKHKLLVVGGAPDAAEACANILWSKMSPDTRIHLVTAREAEIVKLIENFYGAMKVTFANCMFNFVNKSGQSPIKVHQAWSEDGRTDPMHTRVTPGKRGWKSHCYDKDIRALEVAADLVGAKDLATLANTIEVLNQVHLSEN